MRRYDVEQVRGLWRELARAPDGFASDDLVIVAADAQQVAPPGWVGIVELESQVVIACPAGALETVRAAVSSCRPGQLLDPEVVAALLRPAKTLGPALLFYGIPEGPLTRAEIVGPLDPADDRVRAVAAGLLPQWRAGVWNAGSIALARSLALRSLGRQHSLLIPEPESPPTT